MIAANYSLANWVATQESEGMPVEGFKIFKF